MGEVSSLNQLYQDFRDKGFEFLTVYVREPHPGEHYHEHHDMDQKLQYARECREKDGILNPIVIDDLEGTVHRQYGEMPNMIYIVNKDGRVVYRAQWTENGEIASVLADLVHADEAIASGHPPRAAYTEKMTYIFTDRTEINREVLGRAGPKSVADHRKVLENLPKGT